MNKKSYKTLKMKTEKASTIQPTEKMIQSKKPTQEQEKCVKSLRDSED